MFCLQQVVEATKKMQSIRFEQASCPKCGLIASKIIMQGADYLYHVPGEYYVSECQNCGFWFQNPRPKIEYAVELYPSSYIPHIALEQKVAMPTLRFGKTRYLVEHLGYTHLATQIDDPIFDWRSLPILSPFRRWQVGVSLLPKFVPEGRLLEIGCGNGERLLFLQQHGWKHLYGVELVAVAAEQAQSQGLHVVCGTIEEKIELYPDNHFDVIMSSMVLEHLYDPFAVVKQVAAKLKPGGQFLFSTVTRDSLDAKLYGKFWAGFDFPRHMVYLRRKDIEELVQERFEQLECFHQSAPIDFVRSSTWCNENGKGRFFDKVVAKWALSFPGQMICLLLAWLGMTTRASFRCRKKP